MRFFLLFLFTLLITACATLPTATINNQSWQAERTQVTALSTWQAAGSIGAHAGQNGWSATYNWRQQINSYDIDLMGPLGASGAHLQGNSDQITLTTTDGKSVSAHDPDSLLQQQLGWTLPIANLNFWIKGIPAPNAPFTVKFDTNQQLQQLNQQGWTILYSQFTRVNGLLLPTSLNLINQNITIRIVIRQWKI